MKLLLASKEKFLIEKGYSLLDIPKEKLKIGCITTALEVVEDLDYLAYMKEYNEEMVKTGILFEKFDIKDKTEKEIRDFFINKNVIQVNGGNLFYLLKVIKETNFDKILKNLLDNGLWYIGCSAGTYIMCPTAEVATWKNGRNRYGLTNLDALNYVPFLIKGHYTDKIKDKILEKSNNLKYPLRILRDNQAFIIKDDNCTFIGDEEVKI